MLRFLLVALFVILFLILSIPVFLVEWILGKFNPRARDISSLRIVQWAFKVVTFLSGTTLTVIGEEHVPRDQAVLYIGNHRSFFDIVLTYARCPNLTGYVAKKEILKVPLLSRWMKFLYCLFLDRTDLKAGLKTILTAIDYVKSGISIMIFPEGTRNKNASELDLLPFHEGSFKIATKTGCPIIPVTINNSSAIFEDHFPRITPVHVTIEYGAPIYPKELTREQQKFLGKYVRDLMADTLKRNAA